MEKTRVGCYIKRDFLMSSNYQDYDYFQKLRDNGFKELYYTAPYHWGVLNPDKKQIITYTEGDVYTIDCPSEKLFIEEAENNLKFIKDNYPHEPIVWSDGEDFVQELRKKIKL
jgi:intein-encoded DNA endonuclease-like protein